MKRDLMLGMIMLSVAGCSSSASNPRVKVVENATPAPVVRLERVEVPDTTDVKFKGDVLSSKLPVFVEFYTTWCGPCQIMSPIIDQIATAYQGKLRVFRMDVDRNPQTAKRYQVTSFPFYGVFKDGVMIQMTGGAMPKAELCTFVERAL